MAKIINLVAIYLLSVCIAYASELPDKKRTPFELYASPEEALALHNVGALFIDVRSLSEVTFVGLPTAVDRVIPYMAMTGEFDEAKGTYKLELNPYFAEAISQELAFRGLSKDHPIILMCRSGSRSAKAANLLYKLGYSNVYSIDQGFEGDKVKDGEFAGWRKVNGWKMSGLDWSYKIREGQEYVDPSW
jgi:rhodanese-related sulfurtransferase